MATNNFSSTIIVEPLTFDNYKTWSAWMKNYLLAQDLWDIVEGTVKPEDDSKAWRKNNAAALHAIQISCAPNILYKIEIEDISSAKTVWDKLAKICVPEILQNVSSVTEPVEQPAVDNDLDQYAPLRTAINSGNWDAANDFLSRDEGAKSARISVNRRTVLHVAVFARRTKIVEKLVELLSAGELEIKDDNGFTALAQASILQKTRMVKCMLRKNTNLLYIQDNSNRIPLITALEYRNIELARYLFSASLPTLEETDGASQPSQTLSDIDRSTVLTLFILLNIFDLALDLLQRCPRAAIVQNKYDTFPLQALASNSSAFPSGNTITEHILIRMLRGLGLATPHQLAIRGLGLLHPIFYLLELGIMLYARRTEVPHYPAHQLLHQMCSHVKQMNGYYVKEAILQAVKGGIAEFIDEIIKVDDRFLYTTDTIGRNILFYAVLHRQDKIFSLIHQLDEKKLITNILDNSGSTILHMAAMLEPSTTRDCIPGEALKMRSELQWFKEVERICPPWIKDIKNDTKMTARELFTQNHKNMMKEGEKWMKETASASTVVGALIFTIMFTSAFTVPGRIDQNTGLPMFAHRKLFTIFIISDALSLFLSSTSVLIFLEILTSRYAEEDFFQSLPLMMIIGQFILFFSIATMIIAFCAGLFIMLLGKSWMIILVICLAIVTVTRFAIMFFPLLDYMWKLMFTDGLSARYSWRLF